MSNREALRAMKRLGISLNEVPNVEKVIIQAQDEIIEIDHPKVLEIGGKVGEAGFQVLGGEVTRKGKEEGEGKQAEIQVPEDDVEFVASQAGVDKEKARQALIKAHGDIAGALMELKKRGQVKL
ncbi:MAG: nascent polypeptide-associated complex protein [Thermoprotei archaeon]|nr:nascent polypeptide-associated complex protein [TACK group archaeon]